MLCFNRSLQIVKTLHATPHPSNPGYSVCPLNGYLSAFDDEYELKVIYLWFFWKMSYLAGYFTDWVSKADICGSTNARII